MTYTYNDKIKKLNLGEWGDNITDYESDDYIGDIFNYIAEANVDYYNWELMDWAKNHIDEVDEAFNEIFSNATMSRFMQLIAYAQERAFCDDIYSHGNDILLYYAYNYVEKNNIELSDEKLEQLEKYIKTVDIDNTRLKDIENYCGELNK